MSSLEKDYEILAKELAAKIADITSKVQELNVKIKEVQLFALENNLDFPGINGTGNVGSWKAAPKEAWDNSGCSFEDDGWESSGVYC